MYNKLVTLPNGAITVADESHGDYLGKIGWLERWMCESKILVDAATVFPVVMICAAIFMGVHP